jgi:OOP family OmpA-OmpF porin
MKKFALVAILAASASSAALAETYVFGSIGQGNYKSSDLDKNTTSFNLGAGYGLGNGLSLEAGYLSFGNAKVEGVDLESSGLFGGVAYDLPLSNTWSLATRLGVTNLKTEASVGPVSVSTTKVKPYAGIGGVYAVNSNLKVEAGVSFTEGEFEGVKFDLRNISVGVRYAF